MHPFNTISKLPKDFHAVWGSWPSTKKLVFTALSAAFAAMLQAAGGLLPGIGFLFSPFSTLMVVLTTIISFRYGVLSYATIIILLALIEPNELFIFPFTTGLLGLGIGWCLYRLNNRIIIILLNSVLLYGGICFLLYGLGFLVLGSYISTIPSVKLSLIMFAFSILYSWLWLEFSLFFLKKITSLNK